MTFAGGFCIRKDFHAHMGLANGLCDHVANNCKILIDNHASIIGSILQEFAHIPVQNIIALTRLMGIHPSILYIDINHAVFQDAAGVHVPVRECVVDNRWIKGRHISMGVFSDGSYNVPIDIVFIPSNVLAGQWTIRPGFDVGPEIEDFQEQSFDKAIRAAPDWQADA
ncbi:uncharacterized protein LOC115755883 [Rhodamnia argentea]|uniref:Uncharacterized protein LOC115755883 n=1 Tax=Rhodamnia argentea TaxID=178133 RepID=A0A8B8QVU8_9MYRT|nr:uncharacterized protein LOC115755883 [Rhodamnia argentea]